MQPDALITTYLLVGISASVAAAPSTVAYTPSYTLAALYAYLATMVVCLIVGSHRIFVDHQAQYVCSLFDTLCLCSPECVDALLKTIQSEAIIVCWHIR